MPATARHWRSCRLVCVGLIAAAAIVAGRAGAAELSARDVAMLDRLSFGVSGSSAAHLQRIGAEKWLQEQLHPPATSNLPAAVRAQIAAMPDLNTPLLEIAAAFEQQGKAAFLQADTEQKKAAMQAHQQAINERAQQAMARSILRALYAPEQLRERLTWFWFNHFNVRQYKANIRVLVGDYEDRAIRPFALGRFRDLLAATLRHPAMLAYLDNVDNAAGRVNENYARELLELHTMGVGSGYSQADVEALAKILTGVGVDTKPENPKLKPEWQALLIRDGAFEFNPARHDFGDKNFLGRVIKGRGFAEVDEALDLICRQPATAAHVSKRLATYFVADEPPAALVQKMAQTFQKTDGDIAAVVATMVHSPEFAATLTRGAKFKDPVQYVYSAVRLAFDDKVILNTLPIQNWLNRLGEGLFSRDTPDGYPMISDAWNGPGQMMVRFEIARQIGFGQARLFKSNEPNAVEQPAFPLVQNAFYFNNLKQALSPTTLAALDQAISPQDWNTLFLSSPEFMH